MGDIRIPTQASAEKVVACCRYMSLPNNRGAKKKNIILVMKNNKHHFYSDIATHASVKKVVTCSRKMAILSHKIKITTIKI
jgi:hypothetical protein